MQANKQMVVILSLAMTLGVQSAVRAKDVKSIEMPVFYVTDRQRDGGNSDPQYNCKRRYAEGVELGQCQVAVPSTSDAREHYNLGWRNKTQRQNKIIVDNVKSQYREPAGFYEDVLAKLRNADRVILFVHGYNNGMDVALQRAADFGLSFGAPVIAYCWPSNEKTLHYIKDECNAEWSLLHFRRFLADLENAVGDQTKIMIVGHSMGNRLLMWALNARAELNQAKNVSTPKFCDLVLTSPDIDSGTFNNYAANVCSSATESWILISAKDKALGLSRRVHGRARLGTSTVDNVDVDWRRPPEIPGLKTVEFTAMDKGFIGHSIQTDLIKKLALKGVENKEADPIKLKLETDGHYQWYRVLSGKEKRKLETAAAGGSKP